MSRSTRRRLYSIVAVLLLLTWSPVAAGPPPTASAPPVFPGETIASQMTRWIGPYVLLQTVMVEDSPLGRVTWFSPQGEIAKEVVGTNFGTNRGYITEYVFDTVVIHSIRDTSSLKLVPNDSKRIEYLSGHELGRYFLAQYESDRGMFTDYYANGYLVGAYGPHCWMVGNVIEISSSGSLAYTRAKTTASGHCMVVVTDSLGQDRFSFEANGTLLEMVPSLTGECVVVRYNQDTANERGPDDYFCYYSSGDIVRANLKSIGKLLGWVPGTYEMMVVASVGEEWTYSLLDWETGDIKWSVADPLEYTPTALHHGFALSEDYLILSGLAIRESIAHGPIIPNNVRGPIRMLAAIDIRTGRLASKWYEPVFRGRWAIAGYNTPMPNSGGELTWYENELYHITDVNCSKIDFLDIRNLKNGWVGPSDSGFVCRNMFR